MNSIPIEVKLEKIKNEIIKTINEFSNKYNISYYLLFYIIKDIYNQIEDGKNKELTSIINEVKNIDTSLNSNNEKLDLNNKESESDI